MEGHELEAPPHHRYGQAVVGRQCMEIHQPRCNGAVAFQKEAVKSDAGELNLLNTRMLQ